MKRQQQKSRKSDLNRYVMEADGIELIDEEEDADTKGASDQPLPFIPDGWTLEDVKAWMSQPRHPAGTAKGGQWSGGPSAKNYGPQMPQGGQSAQKSGGSGGFSMGFNNGTMRDDHLRSLVSQREGGDQNARIVTRDEFVAAKGEVLYRGVAGPDHVDSNLNGEWTGVGIYGNGNYFSNFSHEAADYAGDDGWMFAAKLAPNAKVADNSQLSMEFARLESEGKLPKDVKDLSHYAVKQGYDAIEVDFGANGQKHIVVLNNKSLIVNGDTLPKAGKIDVGVSEKNREERIERLTKEVDKYMADIGRLATSGDADGAMNAGMAYTKAFQELSKLKSSASTGNRRSLLQAEVERLSK